MLNSNNFITRRSPLIAPFVCILASVMLSGCATLPSSGPTGATITKSAQQSADLLGLQIVELTDFSAIPARPTKSLIFSADDVAPPTDQIGPNDVLDIAIFEAGVTLFSGTRAQAAGAATNFDPSVQVQQLPPTRVDDNGYIRLPFVGRLRAAGQTVPQLEAAIRQSLKSMSQDPQVLITIRDAITNSVIVGGEVGKPGRLVLPTNRETLSDVVALAGGYRGDSKDLSVRILRREIDAVFRLSDVLDGPDKDLRVMPGDKVTVIRAPQTFAVLGAPGRVEQIQFTGPSISLAEAVALAGGTNPNQGDPKAIFVFRFIQDSSGQEKPIIYHLDMSTAGAFFIAQRFAMANRDTIYVGNAEANQPSKLVQIIGQLFAPIVTVRSITTGN